MPTITILRAPSGAGKSTYAATLLAKPELTKAVSADHFFMKDGHYRFDASSLAEAHKRAQDRALFHIRRGLNVVVDNTNLLPEHFVPYLLMAYYAKADYLCTIWEPESLPSVEELVARNVHGVDEKTIRRQLSRFKTASYRCEKREVGDVLREILPWGATTEVERWLR